ELRDGQFLIRPANPFEVLDSFVFLPETATDENRDLVGVGGIDRQSALVDGRSGKLPGESCPRKVENRSCGGRNLVSVETSDAAVQSARGALNHDEVAGCRTRRKNRREVHGVVCTIDVRDRRCACPCYAAFRGEELDNLLLLHL